MPTQFKLTKAQRAFESRTVKDLGKKATGEIGRRLWDRSAVSLGVIIAVARRPCRARECPGVRVRVLWEDGEKTHVCLAGCTFHEDTKEWQVGKPRTPWST